MMQTQCAVNENHDGRKLRVYYRARYYNPQIGRFISEDPLGFAGRSTNFYAYTFNSPTNFTDASGKQVGELAMGGAEVGSFAGPWGTVIGAAAGAAIGLAIAYEAWRHYSKDANPPDDNPADKEKGKCTPKPKVSYPGNDPNVAPNDWPWKGKGAPDTGGGRYVNPDDPSGRWHPDLSHPDPIGPHWDYTDPSGTGWRVYPDGSIIPK
jgi:RHS repeat-associated protein